jgi:hypothetical protein
LETKEEDLMWKSMGFHVEEAVEHPNLTAGDYTVDT